MRWGTRAGGCVPKKQHDGEAAGRPGGSVRRLRSGGRSGDRILSFRDTGRIASDFPDRGTAGASAKEVFSRKLPRQRVVPFRDRCVPAGSVAERFRSSRGPLARRRFVRLFRRRGRENVASGIIPDHLGCALPPRSVRTAPPRSRDGCWKRSDNGAAACRPSADRASGCSPTRCE